SFVRDYANEYLTAFTQRDVLTFFGVLAGLTFIGMPASYFRAKPGLAWSWLPSVDNRAREFSGYACKKVVPYKVSFSGNAAEMGLPRKSGVIREVSASRLDMTDYGLDIERDVKRAARRSWTGRPVMRRRLPRSSCRTT